MSFTNSVVGGQGALVRPAIKSPNFVHGVTGWSIDKNGTAEFQSVIVPPGSGGAQIFVQATAPSGANAGDLWVNTSAGNEIAQWSGSAWVPFQWGTGSISSGAITAALIAANTITAAQIAASTITAAQIAASTITATQLAAGSVTTTQLAANAVTAAKIAAGTITASQIAAATITAAQIASGTITATLIAAGTITAAKLAAGLIVAGIVDGTTITGAQIVADGTSGQILIYSGAPTSGNLIASISGAAGTDAHGNAFVAGIASYGTSGSYVILAGNEIEIGASGVDVNPATVTGGAGAMRLLSGNTGIGSDVGMGALMQSRANTIGGTVPQLCLGSGTPVPATSAMLEVQGPIYGTGILTLQEHGSPATMTGAGTLYVANDGSLHYKGASGTDTKLANA